MQADIRFSTRCEIFGELGVDMVIKTTFDDRFAALTERGFLEKLFKNNLVGVACGFDYTFGSNKKGSVKELKDYCNTNGVDCFVLERQDFEGEKISTRYINGLLTDGKIEEANLLLGDSYRYSGVVVHGHEIGRTIGFRTVNLVADDNVVLVKTACITGLWKWMVKNTKQSLTWAGVLLLTTTIRISKRICWILTAMFTEEE